MCVFAVTTAGSALVDCRTLVGSAPSPIGAFDAAFVTQENGKASIRVSGWGMNSAATAEMSEMNFYLKGPSGQVTGFAFPADKPRPDLEAVFGTVGPNHGFVNSLPLDKPGAYEVCAYVNVGSYFGSQASFLGCRALQAQPSAPYGALDFMTNLESNGVSSLSFGGWAIDRALPTQAINVDVYIDRPNGTSVGVRTSASGERRDVGAAYPGTGTKHGFSGSLPVSSPGVYRACAFAIGESVFGAGNSLLGCTSTTVSAAAVVGAFDSATAVMAESGKGIAVRGWSADPGNPKASGAVDVYVDSPDGSSKGYRLMADKSRPDVASAFPAYGDKHGLVGEVPVNAGGRHRVCAFGIPTSTFGQSALLGCVSVVVP
jgi:hypothetical protein